MKSSLSPFSPPLQDPPSPIHSGLGSSVGMSTQVSVVPKTIKDLKQSQRESHQTMAHKIIRDGNVEIETPHMRDNGSFEIRKA
jgi:hypothetical protein